MRKSGGIEEIYKAIERLSLKHKEHIAMYGQGNENVSPVSTRQLP